MNTLFKMFFDLESIPDDADGLVVSWINPISGWVWLIIILVLIGISTWSYRRWNGYRYTRIFLSGIRFTSLLLLVILISGPQILFPREVVEEDVVMFMLDRSGSMTIEDTIIDGVPVSRDQQLRGIIGDNPDTWSEIEKRSDVEWYGFSSGVFGLDTIDQSSDRSESNRIPVLDEPDGWNTDIPNSIRQVIETASNRPISSIILMSDGRSNQMPGRSLSRLIRKEGIPVISVPLGSTIPVHDLSISRVRHPDRAFIRDSIPVHVTIQSVGDIEGATVSATLIDKSSGETMDTADAVISGDRSELLLTATMNEPGIRDLIVRIESEENDLFTENDVHELRIDVVDRPIRILYVEGYPRWEYRYLKNLLVREASIESSVMLLSADRDFAQEGNAPISRLPRTTEEMEPFDLMIIGDVPAGFFSTEQLELFSRQVSEEGMGLFWIGGPRDTPSSWAGSALDDLLPMRSPFELEESTESLLIRPTEFARDLGVLVLDPEAPDGWFEELSDPRTGWSELHSMQIIDPDQLKPTSEALATASSASSPTHPALLLMRFGSGQVLYSTMDDIWRWRFGRGEELTDRWWIGLIRFLARQSLDTSGNTVDLMISPDRLTSGSTSEVMIRVHDQRLEGSLGETIPIEITPQGGGDSVRIELTRSGDEATWKSDWSPDRPGRFIVEVLDPLLGTLPEISGNTIIEVERPDDEFIVLDTDHELMAGISNDSGGFVVAPDEIERIPELLPNRDVLIENPIIVPIWNTGTFLYLLITLLSIEWIIRRLVRMT